LIVECGCFACVSATGACLTLTQVYDFVNSELEHNQSYAYRLPPTYKEQAQGFVNFHENGLFHSEQMAGIGNSTFWILDTIYFLCRPITCSVAGRTILSPILQSLERIAFNGDPLQFLLIHSTYQPFISLMHMTGLTNGRPDLEGVRKYNGTFIKYNSASILIGLFNSGLRICPRDRTSSRCPACPNQFLTV
jgi:hypothetical protein